MSTIFKTNKFFIKVFESSNLNQRQFGELVFRTQPAISEHLNNVRELTYSELERYMSALGLECEINIKKDENFLNLIHELKLLEVKLIKEFSKEVDYEKKYALDKKIQAIKVLIDE